MPWWSKLKFRYSQGLVGNDYARNRWLYVSEYTDNGTYIREGAGANSVAQWEEAMKRDLGIELGFLNNDITFSVDLFDEHRYKMLTSMSNSVPMWVGNSYKELNKGEIKKHGFELEAQYRKSFNNGIAFYVKGNFGANENRILVRDDAPYTPSYRRDAGMPIGSSNDGVFLSGGGYYTSIDDIHSTLSPIGIEELVPGDLKYLDYNADGVLNAAGDKTRLYGSTQPLVQYAFGGGITWRGFEFSFLFQGYGQKYVDFGDAYEYEFYAGNYVIHTAQLDYWSPQNTGASHAALHYTEGNMNNYNWAGFPKIEGKSWRRADFLRLKDASIGYTLKSKKVKDLVGVEGIKFYVTGNNLLTFTDLVEGDPESTSLRFGTYPQMRTVKLGLQIAF
jgi:hypothetical protein